MPEEHKLPVSTGPDVVVLICTIVPQLCKTIIPHLSEISVIYTGRLSLLLFGDARSPLPMERPISGGRAPVYAPSITTSL